MFKKANPGRDAFTFSLHGLTTIASFTPVAAIAQDRINKAWDRRLEGVSREKPSAIRRFEDFLGRYYASGCCQPV